MKELLLVCAVAVMIVFGYFIMKRLDDFLANNHHLIDEEIAENSLLLRLIILWSLIRWYRYLKSFQKESRIVSFHFLFGNTEDIYDKLNKNRIDFCFIRNNASANDDTYRCLIISTKQNSIICEKAGCTTEPLEPSVIQTAVIWKKASNNAFANSFSDFLFSNQAVINAEYVK